MNDSDENPEDILSSALLSLYDYQPITLSSAGSVFIFASTAQDQATSQVTLRTPDTQAANWQLHASSVWIASLFLAEHIDYLDLPTHLSQCPPGKRVKLLELGAAAGLPGIVIAKSHPQVSVIVSDYPDADLVRTLSENVAQNGVSANCRALAFGWGSDPVESGLFLPDGEKFDVLIAADTLWNSAFHSIFIESLRSTLKRTPHSRVHLFAGLHTGRYTIESFLNAVSAAGFDLEKAFEAQANGQGRRSWKVEWADSEDESERRRWIVYFCLKWRSC